MRIGHQLKFVVVYKQANSLFFLIADGKYRATSLGRTTWKKLIGSPASLQPYCNREGFNAISSTKPDSKARIGIVSKKTIAVPVNPESVLAREGISMSRTLVEIMHTQQAH